MFKATNRWSAFIASTHNNAWYDRSRNFVELETENNRHSARWTASALNMGLIAFNRYIRVAKPALYGTIFPNKIMARFYRVVVWIVAILFTTPPLYGWGKLVYHPFFLPALLTLESGEYFINHSYHRQISQRKQDCNILLLLQNL